MRPGDANEVVEAWKVIMPLRHDPVALILSRQAMPTLDRTRYAAASGVAQGGYVLAGDPDTTPDVILIASGTEVGLAVEAYEQLVAEGVNARVVSMASMELFDRQSKEYRNSVLPPAVTARVVIEQGTAFGLDRWAGTHGCDRRDEHLRRLRPAQGAAAEVRLHRRARGGTRQGADRRVALGPSVRIGRCVRSSRWTPVTSGAQREDRTQRSILTRGG